ncbi:hypothetical protein N9L68_06700 [bacterium]|nr:hypothetical protein [bacterium]
MHSLWFLGWKEGIDASAPLRLPARLHKACNRRRAGMRLLLRQKPSPAGLRLPKHWVRVLQRPNELAERLPRGRATMWPAQYSPEQEPPGARAFSAYGRVLLSLRASDDLWRGFHSRRFSACDGPCPDWGCTRSCPASHCQDDGTLTRGDGH